MESGEKPKALQSSPVGVPLFLTCWGLRGLLWRRGRQPALCSWKIMIRWQVGPESGCRSGQASKAPLPPIGSVGKSWSGGKQDQVIAPRGQNSWGEKGKREFFTVDNAQGGWSVGK